MWAKVLQEVPEGDCALAMRLLGSFLVAQTQSAKCERMFVLIVELQKHLSKSPTEPFEQYLLISQCGCDPQESSGWIAAATWEFLSSERRLFVAIPGEFYRKGRKLVQRKRTKRKDAGQKRKSYKRTKATKQLRSYSNARLLVRRQETVAEFAEQDVAEDAEAFNEHDVMVQLSPRRSKEITES